jgi:hypothetical protein
MKSSIAIAASAFSAVQLTLEATHAGWAYLSALSQAQMEITVAHWGNRSIWGMKASAKALADAIISGADDKMLTYRGYRAEFALTSVESVEAPAKRAKVKAKRSVSTEEVSEEPQAPVVKRAKRAVVAAA